MNPSADNFDILIERGAAFFAAQRFDSSATSFEQALQLRPNHVETIFNLGMAYQMGGRLNDAAALYERVLSLRPSFVEAWANLGAVYWATNRLEDVVNCHEQALRIQPSFIHSLIELGCAFAAQDKPDKAEAKFQEALRINPNNASAYSNLGALRQSKGDLESALAFYDKALRADPHYHHARFQKSLALLSLGRYREGWALYDASHFQKNVQGLNQLLSKKWDGSPSSGTRLLICCEQGYGDSIQFIRYAALCKKRASEVLVWCPRPLLRLFKNCPGVDSVHETLDGLKYDASITMMNLPHIFGTTLETVPADIPYLYVDSDAAQKWAPKFAGVKDTKIGLVWASGSPGTNVNSHLLNRWRSIDLRFLTPLFETDKAHFYSLQKGPEAKQRIEYGLRDRIIDFMDEVEDFMDTAALIKNLDLVITVDTSVAHLAGALGKKVWILSRFDADWRWLQNRAFNPWYPTARIFGQSSLGDWEPVIKQVQEALSAIC